MVTLQNPVEIRTRWSVGLINVMLYFAFEPYATYLINNIHVLTQDSLLQIYFMFGSTLNIFCVKAKYGLCRWGAGGGLFSQCGIAIALKRCLTKFSRFHALDWNDVHRNPELDPSQQITRIMHNGRFLTPVLIKILYLGCIVSLRQKRTDILSSWLPPS